MRSATIGGLIKEAYFNANSHHYISWLTTFWFASIQHTAGSIQLKHMDSDVIFRCMVTLLCSVANRFSHNSAVKNAERHHSDSAWIGTFYFSSFRVNNFKSYFKSPYKRRNAIDLFEQDLVSLSFVFDICIPCLLCFISKTVTAVLSWPGLLQEKRFQS